MKWQDWTLVTAWLGYLALLGPFLVSEDDWMLLGAGLVIPVILMVLTVKRFKFHYE